MYVVILGGGRIGRSLARWVANSQHEVTVIEKNPLKCAGLDEELGSISLFGNGTEPNTLRQAGTKRASTFIATTSIDDDNLMSCQLAKHVFGVTMTMSVVNSHSHHRLFELLGIGTSINIPELILGRLREEVSKIILNEETNL